MTFGKYGVKGGSVLGASQIIVILRVRIPLVRDSPHNNEDDRTKVRSGVRIPWEYEWRDE